MVRKKALELSAEAKRRIKRMENITLKLDGENFPQLLGRYSLEKLKEMAVNMALKQYS
jgi:tRNA(His) 5'-end guanylyltransferase